MLCTFNASIKMFALQCFRCSRLCQPFIAILVFIHATICPGNSTLFVYRGEVLKIKVIKCIHTNRFILNIMKYWDIKHPKKKWFKKEEQAICHQLVFDKNLRFLLFFSILLFFGERMLIGQWARIEIQFHIMNNNQTNLSCVKVATNVQLANSTGGNVISLSLTLPTAICSFASKNTHLRKCFFMCQQLFLFLFQRIILFFSAIKNDSII